MQQLTSLTLVLKPGMPIERPRPSQSFGPYLQGALMERIDSGYATLLHQQPFNPYSQYCYWEGDTLIWRISTVTNDAMTYIIEPLRTLDTIHLRATNVALNVTKTTQETITLKSLQDTVKEPGPSRIRVQFITPTSFKSHGEYVIMPSVRLIAQNLLMHYGQVYEDNKEGYAETIDYIDKNVRITSYNLRSCPFGQVARKGREVPAFIGTAAFTLRGPDMVTGLVRMLLKFGEYAGVGIKTSMGMGGFKLIQTASPKTSTHEQHK